MDFRHVFSFVSRSVGDHITITPGAGRAQAFGPNMFGNPTLSVRPMTFDDVGSIKIRGVKVADIDVSNVQTPTPNACAAFRRRAVSPFDPS